MPLNVPDAKQYPWDLPLKMHLAQAINPSTGGINTWATNPTVGVDGLPLGANHVGYSGINTTSSSLMRWDGAGWVTTLDGEKVVTTPQLEVHVNQASGNDNNDGRTASTAWKTISKFYQEVNRYALGGKQVTLNLGAGTYRINLPPSTWGGRVLIVGSSNASVIIQQMAITNSTVVTLRNVTLAYPEYPTNTNVSYAVVAVYGGSMLQIGTNVVLGAVGAYNVAANTRHIGVYQSQLRLYANAPVTLTGSVNLAVILQDSIFYNIVYQEAAATQTLPNRAPSVDTGVVYNDGVTPLTPADTTVLVNAIGNVTTEAFFYGYDGTQVSGNLLWRMSVTGSLSGSAYNLATGSIISGSVSRGSVPTSGIGYPSSISAGVVDATSKVTGTVSF